ncbi:SAM-dependent methyltransferase [Lysobacter dokdonensis DS-58]|uniref:SAM-dependent methyltransferase n=1 Tax=Lysobacter dokdonensis DS-58 TaxID=1300345 RepID=A0A0A2WM16_9GAMM|nr:class I SAM-dependent methyltransferase [Lysobacter dokdonensis]KGQ20863.1 SAM-dependent methyltransferase [Lysobacter dokdonensis DS-58]
MNAAFHDHFSAVAAQYAQARPEYPRDLFGWIESLVLVHGLAWEPGCGSGQATRDLAPVFDRVHATDPSASQIAQAHGPSNVKFVVEPGEATTLADASVDAVCVAQALHWFDQSRFFAECDRVLKPGGVLFAWGYQDMIAPDDLEAALQPFRLAIESYWPPERRMIDQAYRDFAFPFEWIATPVFELRAEWTLARMLGYFSSYSATKRYIDANGVDPVATHAPAIAKAWGQPDATRVLRWPMFVHARRKLEDGCSPD